VKLYANINSGHSWQDLTQQKNVTTKYFEISSGERWIKSYKYFDTGSARHRAGKIYVR